MGGKTLTLNPTRILHENKRTATSLRSMGFICLHKPETLETSQYLYGRLSKGKYKRGDMSMESVRERRTKHGSLEKCTCAQWPVPSKSVKPLFYGFLECIKRSLKTGQSEQKKV